MWDFRSLWCWVCPKIGCFQVHVLISIFHIQRKHTRNWAPLILNQPISCQFHFVGYTLLHPRKCHQQKADFTPHKTADTSWSIYIYVYIYAHKNVTPRRWLHDVARNPSHITYTLTNLWVCSGSNHFGIRTRGMKCFIYIYIYIYIYICTYSFAVFQFSRIFALYIYMCMS